MVTGIIAPLYTTSDTLVLLVIAIPLAAFGGKIIGANWNYVTITISDYIFEWNYERKQLKKENDPNNERVLLIKQYYLDQRNIKDINIYINSLGMKIVKISYSPLEKAHYVGVDKFVNIPHRIDIANVYGEFDWYGIR